VGGGASEREGEKEREREKARDTQSVSERERTTERERKRHNRGYTPKERGDVGGGERGRREGVSTCVWVRASKRASERITARARTRASA